MNGQRADTRRKRPGLTEKEFQVLWDATRFHGGKEKLRQLEFTFALVQWFKDQGRSEMEVPKRLLCGLPGAHSGTYMRRLLSAEAARLIRFVPGKGRAHGRRLRLELSIQADGELRDLVTALQTRDLGWLSPYLRRRLAIPSRSA